MIEQFGSTGLVKPLLTFAIPTYNRAPYLSDLLRVLDSQLKGERRVEVIISDNASTDETPAVVTKFLEDGAPVKYLRNQQNIGADANFRQCLEQASGKYLWVFGDDDLLIPGAIARILAYLEAGEYGVVYINPYEFQRDHLLEKKEDRFGRSVEILQDGLQLVQRAGAMITFISAIIINRDVYSKLDCPPLNAFVGTSLLQLGWVCPLLASDLRHLFVWEKLVAGRGGNCSGWGACQVFGINLKQVTETAFGKRRDLADALCNSVLQRWFPDTIMQSCRGGKNALLDEDMHALMKPVYKRNWRYWIYLYPLLRLPLGCARIWYRMLRFANQVERLPRFLAGFLAQRLQALQNSPGIELHTSVERDV